MSVIPNSFPIELRSRRQWAPWRHDGGKKIPNGKSNDPTTWKTFDEVADQDRIGFVISGDDPFCGIDLDGCIVDGAFTPWSVPVLQKFKGVAYGEVSPSGNGVKLLTIANKLPHSVCKHIIKPEYRIGDGKQQIECYDHGRFWAMTGNVGTDFETIGNGQAAVDWLCENYMKGEPRQTGTKRLEPSSDSTPLALLQRGQAYADAVPGTTKGNLRDAAFQLSGNLHALVGESGERLTDGEVLQLLKSWNARNSPLLLDHELQEASVNGRKNGTPPADKPPEDTSNVDECVRRLLDGSISNSTAEKAIQLPLAPKPLTTPASDILKNYVQKLMDGTVEKLTKLRTVLNGIEIGPGLLTVIGAGPGTGKTCVAMQIVFEALECDPNLVVTIANAETTFEGLLRREFARITGIPSRKIRFAELEESERREILEAQSQLIPLVERINVVDECTLQSLIRLASETPGLLIVDYLQKFCPPGDARPGVIAVMAQCRHLAKNGWGVIALSATARTHTKGGSGHDSSQLSQASYRDSGDIEFNADACYLLVDQGSVNEDELQRSTLLKCVKNRHDAKEDRELIFNMRRQRFESRVNIKFKVQHAESVRFNAFECADE